MTTFRVVRYVLVNKITYEVHLCNTKVGLARCMGISIRSLYRTFRFDNRDQWRHWVLWVENKVEKRGVNVPDEKKWGGVL